MTKPETTQEAPSAEAPPEQAQPELPADPDRLWRFADPGFDVEFRNSGDEFNTQYVSIVDEQGNNIQTDPATLDAMAASWAKYRKASR